MKFLHIILRILTLPLIWIWLLLRASKEVTLFSWFYVIHGKDMIHFYDAKPKPKSSQQTIEYRQKLEEDLIGAHIRHINAKRV